MKILEAPTTGWQGIMFSVIDGKREGKLCFFSDHIEIRDQNELRVKHPMDTGDDFHTYRITILRNIMQVSVDGKEVATVTLSNQVAGKAVLFGDFSDTPGENVNAQVEYLAYSVKGAMAP